MPVTTIKSATQYNEIIKSEGISAIEFWTPWEASCKVISPSFTKYSDSYSNLKFYRVDLNDQQDVAMDSGVKLAPAFHFYKDGKKIGQYVGDSYPALERTIASYA